MRIITDTCEECGTIVAGNVLERRRVMKCPGLECETVRRFDHLPESDRQHILDNLEKYRME
jgi:hypothetical protein